MNEFEKALAVLGAKEVIIFDLRRQIADLEQRLEEAAKHTCPSG